MECQREGKLVPATVVDHILPHRGDEALFWDVNNGIARRSWARNPEAIFAIKRAMEQEPKLKVTLPNIVNEDLLRNLSF